jgi:hypothetical protein
MLNYLPRLAGRPAAVTITLRKERQGTGVTRYVATQGALARPFSPGICSDELCSQHTGTKPVPVAIPCPLLMMLRHLTVKVNYLASIDRANGVPICRPLPKANRGTCSYDCTLEIIAAQLSGSWILKLPGRVSSPRPFPGNGFLTRQTGRAQRNLLSNFARQRH